ncbi:PA14 domain-containing protein [Micromonospora soli]|uniref:PA14 domain-containing protein n=1 Tax=Micromonospora sp. NBRC 110009 TaxID=3061627 RepID=UPI002672B16E|nr:PA14 domain-containing protein [Micromonospora sp. NBRC 110009]WKT96494.1 PA14 domain-containing protein [Micromonospora sp. NBRC 110009]
MRSAESKYLNAGILVVVCALVAAMLPARPGAAAPPTDFQSSLVVGSGLDGPSGFEIAPDGRIFILERAGKVKVVKDGQLLAQPFADLPSEPTGDRGLIGIAFDPEFGVSNHYVYFYYTGLDLLNHLVRFDASGDVGTNGPYQIFSTRSPSQQLHVGGSIGFGRDGKLYLAVGDNGYPANAQNLSNPHGKVLRIDKDGSIPTDNPFYGQAGKDPAIWAYGFRNPWRFQFDSATGELYGADVGDYTWEELNHIVKGGNYGWPLKEGVCTADCAGFTDPIHAYPHNGRSAAVTGGPVYRGAMFPPQYQGRLFFGDYAQGFIRMAQLDASGAVTAVDDFDTSAGSVVDLKVAADGSLYYLTYYPGELYRVTYNTTSHVPVAQAAADVTKGVGPLQVQFSSAGSSDPDGDPLTYRWDFGDGTTSTAANPSRTYSDVGVFTVRLTVSDGQHQTSAKPIVIQVGIPPTLTVGAPTEGATYRAGDTITYTASAVDAAGFDLNDAALKTEVRLHHGTHVHPFVGPLTGRVGSFTIPTTGEASADTWYEIIVTATDTNGLATTRSVNIYPRKSTFTLATQPANLGLTLDGVPVTTPRTVEGVVGFQRELAAPATAVTADGTVHHFTGWSDNRQIRHVIATPATATTYTATYAPSTPFTGTYFANKDLSGTPVLTRPDRQIDFVWQNDSPAPGVPSDNFSVRWVKSQYFAAGRYRFTTATDDGVRLYIDNRLVIDRWQTQSNTAYDHVIDLGAGNHTLKMEYFDSGLNALAKLTWDATPDQPDESFLAQYWNTPDAGRVPAIPTTPPTLSRNEATINYRWWGGSPAPQIATDHFVARWSRTMNLAPGIYEFAATADDGVRLSVDGVRVIDKWIDQSATTHTARVVIDGGPHNVVMEYYENTYDATAQLTYRQVEELPQPTDYTAEFWNTAAGSPPSIPTGPPVVSRSDARINFAWGAGAPAAGVNADQFVARWTRTDTLSAGVYRFSGVSDDGIRVFVDNVPIVNQWRDQNAAYSVDAVVLGGTHTIRVEYYENARDARVTFDYARVADVTPSTGYAAEYFANRDLSGQPAVTRQEVAVDFDWRSGSPDPTIPADNFSARWTRTMQLAGGTYRFEATGDDGIRVLVDGVVVLNGWSDHSPTTFTADVPLTAGSHKITIEYYEKGGSALARFSEPTLR